MPRVGHDDQPRPAAVVVHLGYRFHASQRVRSCPNGHDRLGRYAEVLQPQRSGLGLGEPVAVLLAAHRHDRRREAILEEGERVIQPSLEDRGRYAVVLGGAEHEDGIGRGLLIGAGLLPDRVRRTADDEHRGDHGRGDDTQHPAHHRAAAARSAAAAGSTSAAGSVAAAGSTSARRITGSRCPRRAAPRGRPRAWRRAPGTASRRRSPAPPRGRSAPTRGRRRVRRRSRS